MSQTDPTTLQMSRLGMGLGVFTLLLGVFAILHGVREMPLLEPDEGRNAEVAREMLDDGQWVVPRFHGLPYLDKPALFFNTVRLSYVLFGRSEGTSRLPSVCFALLTVVATFLLGTRLLGRDKALLGSAVLVTTPLFVGFARIVIFDMTLTCFVTFALLLAEEGRRGWKWGFVLAWGAIALAVLTKGPVGLLLPLLGALGLLLGQGPPYRLGKCFHPLNLAIFLAGTLPWVLTMEARNPGFLHYALLVESFERLTRPTFQRSGPVYYYVPVLLLGLFPWSLAVLGRIPCWCRRIHEFVRQRSPERGLFLAAGAMILFFSFSSSKLPGYVLPSFPLVALLVGSGAARAAERRVAWVWGPGAVLLALGLALLGNVTRAYLANELGQPPVLAEATDLLLFRVGMVSVSIGPLLMLAGYFRRSALVHTLHALWLPATVLVGLGPSLTYAEEHSSHQLAGELRRIWGDQVRVVTLRCFPGGLDYYMGRVIPLVTQTGKEVSSTYVERNIDEIWKTRPRGLWSLRKLRTRAARNKVDVLVTLGRTWRPKRFRLVCQVGKYSLWSPAQTSMKHRSRPPSRGGFSVTSGSPDCQEVAAAERD